MSTSADAAPDTEQSSLGTHVSLCALRYTGLLSRLKRIEVILGIIVVLQLFGPERGLSLIVKLLGL